MNDAVMAFSDRSAPVRQAEFRGFDLDAVSLPDDPALHEVGQGSGQRRCYSGVTPAPGEAQMFAKRLFRVKRTPLGV